MFRNIALIEVIRDRGQQLRLLLQIIELPHTNTSLFTLYVILFLPDIIN